MIFPLLLVLMGSPLAAAEPPGTVQISATLPALATFAPASGPIVLAVTFKPIGSWTTTLPKLCGVKPCLVANAAGTSYRATYVAGKTLVLTKSAGVWRFVFNSNNEDVDPVAAGVVTATITVDGRTFTGSANGVLREKRLVAD